MKAANKRWTEEDATFVKNNLGKLSFEQMGRALNRSAMSVRLFALRNRLTVGLQGNRNKSTSILGLVLWKEKYQQQRVCCGS